MSFVLAVPEMVSTAASSLSDIGSTITTATASAAIPTTGVVAAAGDEVSVGVAALFSAHAQEYQALSARAAAFHAQFVQSLGAGAASYVATEAANASPLQTLGQELLGAVNAPTELLLGRPLIGNGANGAPGTGDDEAP